MRLAIASCCVVPLCVALMACGASSRNASESRLAGSARTDAPRSSTTAQRPAYMRKDADDDYDNTRHRHYDLDDDPIRFMGVAASASDARDIIAVVRHYYAVAATGDAGGGCSLLFKPLADALSEEFAGGSGATQTYGGSCSAVLVKFFKLHHRQFVERNASIEVTGTRVEGERGLALLRFKMITDHHIRLSRERGRWTIRQLFDEGMP